MRAFSTEQFLAELHRRGAARLSRVTFRANRSTIWSLTQRGRTLNVHSAFSLAAPEILSAFAVIARDGGLRSEAAQRASALVSSWPELTAAMRRARAAHERRRRVASDDAEAKVTHCCATPDQRRYLRALYRYFNQTRFGGRLPTDVPVRLSRRMRSSLGHMIPGEYGGGERYIVEIALNVDLMLAGNGAERVDTLLHEMAHAADYLRNGEVGHGSSWQAWARRVGCRPETLYDRPVRRRRRRSDPVERVPPLPHPLRRRTVLTGVAVARELF